MARINFEDDLESDYRFKRLVRIVGDEDKAFGILYRFWKIAQKFWGDDMSLMPESEFNLEGFTPVLEAGLAEVRSNGIYAKGSEERFAWYLQKCRASKLGVAARTEKSSRLTGTESRSTETERRSTGSSPTVNPPSPAPVPVPVPVLSPAPDQIKENIKLNSSDVEVCVKDWIGTLDYFKIERPILPHEKMKIAALLKMHQGDVKSVRYALVGQRFEPKSDSFDPAKHLSLERLFDSKRFEKFINLAAAEKTKQKREQEALESERRHQEELRKISQPPPIQFGSILKSVPKNDER